MPTSRKVLLALIGILVIGAFFRFFRITTAPPGLYPDEAANGNNAVEAIHTGAFKIFYPENNGREGLFIAFQAVSVRVFGPEPWALRLVSAIFGTLTILGIYLATKELFTNQESRIKNQGSSSRHDSRFMIHDSELMGLLAAFFLATSYWHINFSRIGFRAIMVPLFASFAAYWLLKTLRTGKVSSAVLGGVATGLGFHTYIAFRFIPFIIAVPIGYALVRWFRNRPLSRFCTPCLVALYLFVTFIAALPIGLYFLRHPADFLGRSGQVSIFSSSSPVFEFAKSTVLTLGMFNVQGDCNARHNFRCQPELFFPVGILFLIGLAATVFSFFKNPRTAGPPFLLSWFVFMMLPATLTREGLPHALRSIGLIIPVMIMAGLGGVWLWNALVGFLDTSRGKSSLVALAGQIGRIRREAGIVAVLILIWIVAGTAYTYFSRFAGGKDSYGAFSVDLWHQGEFLRTLPSATQKIILVNLAGDDIRGVPAPAQTIMFATNSFEIEPRETQHYAYVTSVDAITFDPTKKALITVMNGQDQAATSAIKKRFPDLKPFAPGDFLTFEN